MFDSLASALNSAYSALVGKKVLTEANVEEGIRAVRQALLEADVNFKVAKSFILDVKARALGDQVIKAVDPGDQFVKVVHDSLTALLGGEKVGLPHADKGPLILMTAGLQGSGKTTTTAKLAKRLAEREGKRVLMASLDTNRPAAMEQLAVLGVQIGVDTLPIVKGQRSVDIAKRAKQQATLGGYDVVMLDTAGRMHVNDELMAEVEAVRDTARPNETLLVVDGLTGQDAVNVAEQFETRLGITGVVLTRMDGDGRGGAALSMRAVTGKPIKFVGLGEKLDALEEFHPERVAGRILGMGDIISLVEKAQETIEADDAERMMKRFQKGRFDMNDMKGQLEQMLKMGGMQGIMGMLPGMGKLTKKMDQAGFDDKVIKRQIAIIQSMTRKERRKPDLMQASRKRRVAAGAGLEVPEVNKLLKMHRQMADMMKKMGKMGKKGLMRGALGQMFGRGGMPPGLAGGPGAAPGGGLPAGFPGLGGGAGGLQLPPGLGGLGKKK